MKCPYCGRYFCVGEDGVLIPLPSILSQLELAREAAKLGYIFGEKAGGETDGQG